MSLSPIKLTWPASEAQSPIHSSCMPTFGGKGRTNDLISHLIAMQQPTNPFLYKFLQNPGRLPRREYSDSNKRFRFASMTLASDTTSTEFIDSNISQMALTLFASQMSS